MLIINTLDIGPAKATIISFFGYFIKSLASLIVIPNGKITMVFTSTPKRTAHSKCESSCIKTTPNEIKKVI